MDLEKRLNFALNVDDIGVENSGATADDKETEKLQAVELEEWSRHLVVLDLISHFKHNGNAHTPMYL